MNSERRTIFSPCRQYRYTLWREWPEMFWFDDIEPGEACAGNRFKYVQFIGLNPSTADENKNDPTIRKCIGFAKKWGYGALCMTNIFAWRDTQPAKMKQQEFPVGVDNLDHVSTCAKDADLIIAAWGKHGAHLQQDKNVESWIRAAGGKLFCLRKNQDGSPMHPLYVPYETKPIPYET